LLPECYDTFSAIIIEQSGFNGAFICGCATLASLLFKIDIVLLTFEILVLKQHPSMLPEYINYQHLRIYIVNSSPTEICRVARNICAAAATIPMIVDAGFAKSSNNISASTHF
jgi:2-methylisocitrate lyase-like PEP mutase family enzyme